MTSKPADRVQTFVRIRPSSHFAHKNIEVLNGEGETKSKLIQLKSEKDYKTDFTNLKSPADNLQKSWCFTVDDVLYNASQCQVYNTVAEGLVERALDGYSGTLIAYGESGSGKTFSLSGARDQSDFGQRGLCPRAIGHIFSHINSERCKQNSYKISISYLEIHGNKLIDLLADNCRASSKKKLEIFEDEKCSGATKVDGLRYLEVNNEVEAFKNFFVGNSHRSSGAHSIFTIYISCKSHTISGGTVKHAELKFVDLASWGSTIMNMNDTLSSSSSNPNKIKAATVPSLSFLEQVIVSLKNNRSERVPWRSCPLTHVLKGSFKRMNTVLFCTIHGDKQHLQGSLTTLRFSARLNNLSVEAAHTEINDAQSRVKVLETEIQKLKDELKMRYVFNRADDKTAPCSNYEPLTEKDVEYMTGNVKEFLNHKCNHLDVTSIRHVNKLFDIMRDEYNSREQAVEEKIKSKYLLVEKNSDEGKSLSSGFSSAKDGTGRSTDKSAGNDKKKSDKNDKSKKSTRDKKSNHNDTSKTSLMNVDSNQYLGNATSSNALIHDARGSSIEIVREEKTPDGDRLNLVEAFEDFKKNSGRVTYYNILNAKKTLASNRKQASSLASQINHLVDEISSLSNKVETFGMDKNNKDSIAVISENEYTLREELADKKNFYIELKSTFDRLQNDEINILSDLENLRKNLLVEFSEENQHSSDIYRLCANLSVFAKEGNTIVYQEEQISPPFTLPQQKEQDDPSFNSWQGARMELSASLRNSSKRMMSKFSRNMTTL